jgi:pre-mRNA-splicing factor SYF1
LDDQGYHSRAGKDRKAFYFELCDLVTHHPEEVTCLDGPQFIKKALTEFPEEAGRVWVQLGDYYARKG